MSKIKMLRTCMIGDEEYSEGSVHNEVDIPLGSVLAWLDRGLAERAQGKATPKASKQDAKKEKPISGKPQKGVNFLKRLDEAKEKAIREAEQAKGK